VNIARSYGVWVSGWSRVDVNESLEMRGSVPLPQKGQQQVCCPFISLAGEQLISQLVRPAQFA
jgi:hypothetical protein